MPGEGNRKTCFYKPYSGLTMGNTKISFSLQSILVYLQLVPEVVRILRARQTVGGGQSLLSLLGISQLGQDGLQTGLEGVNLLETEKLIRTRLLPPMISSYNKMQGNNSFQTPLILIDSDCHEILFNAR